MNLDYDLVDYESILARLATYVFKEIFPISLKRDEDNAILPAVRETLTDGSIIVSATAAFEVCGTYPTSKLLKKLKLDKNSNDPAKVRELLLSYIDDAIRKAQKKDADIVAVLVVYKTLVENVLKLADLEKCFPAWTPELSLRLFPNGQVQDVSLAETNPSIPVVRTLFTFSNPA